MKGQRFLVSFVILAALLIALTGVSQAQATEQPEAIAFADSGFIYAGQVIWINLDCPAPTRMFPDDGDNYVCPPRVKLPYLPRPLIRLP